ncbi:Crp/Fnr family transcriptional regulator [Aquimarina sp. U1-2]|uniref:Crp/Fnr family transcriptional regulator n=1 Tax=Aquimarina sp. U1-2 TaxID=2823141 RepID=UPI001AED0CE4|nr:Crp/Fnr family transcriptional regulator [Aquimarina sp. U1-2]MBP2830791.1 Crp/Fnr family transcriptional regulator [Aquimarina sp. U1-2]
MKELHQFINNYFGVTVEETNQISRFFLEHTLPKGEFFVEKGNYCNQLSFIHSGYLRVFAETEHKEVTQWISTPGYFVTDLSSLLFGTPSRFNIQALTDCSLYTIKRSDYQNLGNYIAKWDTIEKLFIAKCFVTLENRIFHQLSKSAEERYQELFSENPMLFNQIPLQYLASMLGMTPETLSRIRKKGTS